MLNLINYQRLADAISYYTSIGYEYVEVPWAVPRWALAVTCPNPDNVAYIDGEGLVGSAEQSFIALDAAGHLPKGRYVGCSPCFRNGDSDGDLHQSAFMKVELYRTDFADNHAVDEIVMEAMEFFSRELRNMQYVLKRTEDRRTTCDIELNGVEIGSYGIRQSGVLSWVYGTGLAEPRFQMAVSRNPLTIPEYANLHEEFNA